MISILLFHWLISPLSGWSRFDWLWLRNPWRTSWVSLSIYQDPDFPPLSWLLPPLVGCSLGHTENWELQYTVYNRGLLPWLPTLLYPSRPDKWKNFFSPSLFLPFLFLYPLSFSELNSVRRGGLSQNFFLELWLEKGMIYHKMSPAYIHKNWKKIKARKKPIS